MDVARTVAKRSICVRAQVGAVIVDVHNRVVATGYNGPPAGYAPWAVYCDGGDDFHGPNAGTAVCVRGLRGPTAETAISYADCVSVHAEANALMHSDRSRREGGTLYLTSVCCWTCAKMVANSGLVRIVLTEEVVDVQHRHPDQTLQLFDDCKIVVGYV